MIRVRRERTKGWRMPPRSVYVGRPSPWGNPFPVGHEGDIQPWLALALGERGDLEGRRRAAVKAYRAWMTGGVKALVDVIPTEDDFPDEGGTIEYTGRYARSSMGVMMLARAPIHVPTAPDIEPLRAYDALVCWCPLDGPCHADVLLELLR